VTDSIGYAIEPLEGRHDRAAFSCGVEPLDRYLKQQAGQERRRHVANCFVAVVEGTSAVIGYYTLSASSVIFDRLPEAFRKRLPRYPEVPAALLGRLAVDFQHRGRGLGEALLLDALCRTLRADLAAAIFVVDAKDEQAARFYRSYSFLDIEPGLTKMYLPAGEIEKLFARIDRQIGRGSG
jgi:ribosomal protein S18 acetylase RimI-like enzyme